MEKFAVRVVLIACALFALAVPSADAHRAPSVVTLAPTAVGSDSALLNGTVTPYRWATTYQFRYGTTDYGSLTPLTAVPASRKPVAVSAQLVGLEPATVYHAQLVAYGPRRVTYGIPVTFQTAVALVPPALIPLSPAAPAVFVAPPPVFGERVNVAVRQGTVSVKAPGGGSYVPLTEFASVPVGSMLNTRRGSMTLTSALPRGATQAGIFHGGLSEVRQPKTGRGETALVLRGRGPSCRRARSSAVANEPRRRKRRRSLWGNVRHGSFRIRGGNSVASVRGTIWYVEDRCSGTFTRVRRGSVRVRDLRRHRTVVVRAGHSYLARAAR